MPPTIEDTLLTPGNPLADASTFFTTESVFSMVDPVGSLILMVIVPSSILGKNSRPDIPAKNKLKIKNTTTPVITIVRYCKVLLNVFW